MKQVEVIPIEVAISTDIMANVVIEQLRLMFHIIIYNYMPPFVCPVSKKIMFCYAVKQCSLRDGWNGRTFIGKSEYLDDPLECKRQAIKLAIDFINKNK